MRGKVTIAGYEVDVKGITPAYAGKSRREQCPLGAGLDHPRVCGEKIVLVIVFCSLMGSPPRMRGKVMRKEILRIIHGITPAYAGKSGPCPDRVPPAGDHPRVCGEKSQSTSASPRALGSPPRMRGKGVKQSNSRIRMGITPAYAGKRGWKNCIEKPLGDHPRVCGEKPARRRALKRATGSPPRMRGKAGPGRSAAAAGRITPAYAGKSAWLPV